MKRVVMLTAFVASIAALVSTPGSAYVRTDPVDENYLTGHLYWEGGQGRISWNGPRASQDDVDAGNNTPGLWNSFRSDPLPRHLYLNVSRVIQFDLFLLGSGSQGAAVEIHAGASFLTGACNSGAGGFHTESCTDWSNEIYYCDANRLERPETHGCADSALRPAAPGYKVETYRMLSELDAIESGTVVEVRVVHRSTNLLRFGLAEGHASVVRFPVFSADEVLFRVPRYDRDSQATKAPISPPSVDLLDDLLKRLPLAAAFSPLALASARRGRPLNGRARVALCLALLGATALSGCMGGGRAPDADPVATGPGLGGTAQSLVVPDEGNETGLSNATRGSIYGVVADLDRLPVGGAHVALLETSHAAGTDPRGRFNFPGIVPGPYTLRVDRDGFKPLETRVEVKAASITKVEVFLEYLNPQPVDARPHRHDTWFDASGARAESLVLVDQWLEVRQEVAFVPIPPPLIVPPGTRDVEINLTWGGGLPSYVVPVMGDRNPRGFNDTALYPRLSGTPFHLRTTWEMTDVGHSGYSYWPGFRIRLGGQSGCQDTLELVSQTGGTQACIRDGGNIISGNYTPSPDGGERVRVQVVVHKGVLPLEDGHPDRWEGRNVSTVIPPTSGTMASSCFTVCPLSHPNQPDRAEGLSVAGVGGAEKAVRRHPFNATWQPKGLVPFETTWIAVQLEASRHQIPQDPSDAPWKLFYRTAVTTNYGDCDPFGAANVPGAGVQYFNRDASRSQPVTAAEAAKLTWTWRIPLRVGDADPPYAPYSTWCFYVAPSDEAAALLDHHLSGAGNNPSWAPITFTLTVGAHKEPLPGP